MMDYEEAEASGSILVVDDYEDNLDILCRRLERRGYSLTTAKTGEAALAKISEFPRVFDLVLLDVMMPGIDGFEVLRQIRLDYSPTELPVVMVTAKNQSEDLIKGLRAGANDYVTKPIDFPVLFARVRNHVNLATADRAFRGAQKLLIDAAKMESIGYLAAGVAHEVRNPLAQLQMGIDYIKSASPSHPGTDKDLAPVLEMMEEAVQSADKIVANLMQFSQHRHLDREVANISDLVVTCLRLLRDQIESRNIAVSLHLDPICNAKVDVVQIETAVLNVLTNALQAMPDGGDLGVSTRIRAIQGGEVLIDEGSRTGNELRPGDDAVVLEITDSGPGIPEGKLSAVFDAFYTSHATGQGVGLGLTVAKKIIDLHGGKLEVANRVGQHGALVTFFLPSKAGITTSV